MKTGNRDQNVDYAFLEAMQVTHKWYQPWQLGLWLPDAPEIKFVWYPERGTLMFEGAYTKKLGEFYDTESVYNEMKKFYI